MISIEYLKENDITYQEEIKILEEQLTYNQRKNQRLTKTLQEKEKIIEDAIEYIETCNPVVDLNSIFLNESYISNYGAKELLSILERK